MRTIEVKDILQILNTLPEDKKEEVYDFTEFLLKRTMAARVKKKGLIGRFYGSTKGSKLTTDSFGKMKAEEMAMEDK